MAKEKVKISIIVPSWNTKALLKQCLDSLINSNIIRINSNKDSFKFENYEIIVVDNASNDGSPQMVEKEFPKAILIKNKTNLGYGAANNQGMKKAKGDYFLLLNSDTIVKKNAPQKMAQFLASRPETGVVGCKLLNPDESSQPSAGRFPNLWVTAIMLFTEHWFGGHLVRTSYNKNREVDWVMGAALMVKKEAAKKAGPMDKGIFMYMDETEWCYRIKKAGYKVMFYPEVQIVHFGRGSSKTGRKEPILNIYRGLLHFYKKHYPRWQLPILRIMLKLKATGALFIGFLTKNSYLKQTYDQALKIT